MIKSLGGIDLQLLGLGHNGHIGFNEPDEEFAKTTHCVDLTQSTIEANKRFFASVDDVPKQAYTMGIGTIMKARKILLVVAVQTRHRSFTMYSADLSPQRFRLPSCSYIAM